MRKSLLSSFLIILGLVAMPVSAVGAFAPDRTTYTCPSTTSCPGTDQVTFNSFTNNPNYGDERSFLRAKNADSSNPGFTSGSVDIDSGNAVLMQAFVHNDANPLNANSTANNTQVIFTLPTVAATSQTATAQITASNASPQTISDTATFNASQPFTLAFDTGADVNITQRTDNGNGDFAIAPTHNVSINGNIMTVNLGDFPGGFKNHILVTVRAIVNFSATALVPAAQTTLVCSNITVSPTDSTHATVTATSGVQNAIISSYTFTVKNSSGSVVNTVTQASNIYSFNQSTPGTYTVTAVINTDRGSTPENVNCTHQITVNAAPVVLSSSTTTAAPVASTTTTLPNTGAGDIAGLFVGTSALGGVSHYLYRRKR